MSLWPSGVTLVNVDFSDASTVLGNAEQVHVQLAANFGGAPFITWAGTGFRLFADFDDIDDPTVVPLPPVDQVGWVDPTGAGFTNWSYTATAEYRAPSGQRSSVTRRFAPILSQAPGPVLFSSLNGGVAGVPTFTPPSTGGGAGTEYPQAAASQWTIPHLLGRRPIVTTYDSNGVPIIGDVVSTPTVVTVVWPYPIAGFAELA